MYDCLNCMFNIKQGFVLHKILFRFWFVYLWVPRALITVDSRRPSLAVTWVTYWARRLSASSTVFDRAALPVQSHREPGRWQHSPVVISGPSRRAGGRGTPGGIREQPRSHTSSHKDPTTAEKKNIYLTPPNFGGQILAKLTKIIHCLSSI